MKKHLLRKGKTFYSILGLLIVFSYLPILVALFFTLQTLDHSHTTLKSMLATAQETQMTFSQDANPGRNHMDQLSTLREQTFLSHLGEARFLEYDPDIQQAEKILLSVTPDSPAGKLQHTCISPIAVT